MERIVIEGGRVIDPASGRDETADVVLSDGVVESITPRPGGTGTGDGGRRLDAEGCIVAPGLIDIHVHFREPDDVHEETIATGSAGAVAGGFTSVCCMPNTRPPLDDVDRLRLVAERAEAAAGARVYPVACATRGRAGSEPAPIDALGAAGAVAFSDDGDCVADAGVLDRVLRAVQAAGRCFMQHCQEPTLTVGAAMHDSPLARELGLTGWPPVAEELIIERDVRLNRAIGCPYHAQHLSSGESAAIIRHARAAGQPVTAEVSPHHLLLTEAACVEHGTNAKMNPPLRSQRDVDQLKEAVADGTITILATDHAPHPRASKETSFAEAAFGIVGLECALALYARALVEGGVVDWPRLLAMMTANPARLVGLEGAGLGSLAVGSPADVTVIDPALDWTIEADAFESAGRNCPFDGWAVRGRAIATIVAGRIRRWPVGARARVS